MKNVFKYLFLLAICCTGPAFSKVPQQTLSFYSIVPFPAGESGYSFSVVSDSSIWYTTNRGVYRYNGSTADKVLDVSLFTKTQIEVFLIQALADNDVWVLGHDAKTWEKTLYHYDGTHWQRQDFPQYSNDPADDLVLFKLQILNKTFGYAVGQDGLCYKFDGTRWSVQKPFTDQTMRALWASGPNDIWAGGKNNLIYHYDGTTWKRSPVTDTTVQNYIFDISFRDGDGWAVGTQGILRFEAGVWKRVPSATKSPLQSVRMMSPADGWCGSTEGDLLRFDGEEWNPAGKIPPIILYGRISAVETGGRYTLYALTSAGLWSSFWGTVPTFTDISASSNIHPDGSVPTNADFDGNGTEDLFTSSFIAYPDRLYSNRGDGFYTDITERLHPISGATLVRAAVGDVDNNGLPDVVALKASQPDAWYRNMGGWIFREETMPTDAGLKADRNIVSLADMDNDGDLDMIYLYSGNDSKSPPLIIYYNDGTGKFPSSKGFGKQLEFGATGSFFIADLNGDGREDIFMFNSNVRAEYYVNNPDGTFTESGEEAGLDGAYFEETPFITWACPIDINHDGALDVFMIWRKGKAAFFLSDGHGKFSPGEIIPFDSQGNNPFGAFVDVDNDGDQDLFLLDRFYRNDGGKFTEDKTIRIPHKGSATFADIDADGDDDMFLEAIDQGNRLFVYRNDAHPSNVVSIRFCGIRSNSAGIGSKVTLWKKGAGGSRSLAYYGEVLNTQGMHVAIDTTAAYDLDVRYPGGAVITRSNIKPGRIDVPEFSFPMSVAWDLFYSFKRTLGYINVAHETLKFILLLSIVGLVFVVSLRMNTQKFVRTPVFLIAVLVMYILAVHATIRQSAIAAAVFPLGAIAILSSGFLYVTHVLAKRRESRYISHYKLLERLGEGGMGTVFKAVDIHTKEEVALKVLNPVLLQDAENRKRLIVEGQLLSSFVHPHIVKVYEVSEAKERGYIAMEYLPGGTLKQHLDSNAPLPLEAVKKLSLQVADGIAEIHAHHIIHRDIKTGNVMLDGDGNIRIMDFGLSKSPLVTTMTTLGTVIGTLGYVAPEQVTGIMVDHRVDIFSFGVMLYELCTSRLPFTGENEIAVIHSIFNHLPPSPASIRTDLPAAAGALIMRCLSKNPDERFQTMREVREALGSVL